MKTKPNWVCSAGMFFSLSSLLLCIWNNPLFTLGQCIIEERASCWLKAMRPLQMRQVGLNILDQWILKPHVTGHLLQLESSAWAGACFCPEGNYSNLGNFWSLGSFWNWPNSCMSYVLFFFLLKHSAFTWLSIPMQRTTQTFHWKVSLEMYH